MCLFNRSQLYHILGQKATSGSRLNMRLAKLAIDDNYVHLCSLPPVQLPSASLKCSWHVVMLLVTTLLLRKRKALCHHQLLEVLRYGRIYMHNRLGGPLH